MRPIRSTSPPPRSPSPELFVKPLPSPRRRPHRLTMANKSGTLRSTKSEACLNLRNKLVLPLDEFGSQDLRSRLGQNTVIFPQAEFALPSPMRRGHRRSSAIAHPSSPRSRSPPPIVNTSPPPPLPPLPSFLLSMAHKTTDDVGLQHIYIPDIEFNCSLAAANSGPTPLTHLQFFAVQSNAHSD